MCKIDFVLIINKSDHPLKKINQMLCYLENSRFVVCISPSPSP